MQNNTRSEVKKNSFTENFQECKKSIEEISKKNGWVFQYDSVSDIFYFFDPMKEMDDNSVLIPVSEECVSLMVKDDGIIIGIMMEDFIEYYVPRHEEYDKLADTVLRKKDEIIDPYKKARVLGIFGKCISSLAVKEHATCGC